MPKKLASPKTTGGGGHSFETKVGAYFVANMIADRPPFNPEDGLLCRIDFQTRADGWYLDDLLLTLERGGARHKREFSVKSNAQFTTKQAPADFVQACWEQFLHEGSATFDREKDLLGIVVDVLGQSVSEALSGLRKKALALDSADLARRIVQPNYASQVERDLFGSFGCPSALATRHSVGPQDTGRLLERVLVAEFDFERADSARRREADRACRDALRDESQSQTLWEALLALVDEHRSAGGYLNRTKVIARLGSRFEFKASPRYAADWKRLETEMSRAVATVNDSIGGSLVLDRAAARAEIEKALSDAPVVCLLGGSGLGKTAVAKSLVVSSAARRPGIWFNAQDLEKADVASFEAKWRLDHSLEDVLSSAQGGLLVIDAIDRVRSDHGFRNAALLIKKASSLWATLGWKTLLTCQPEEWDRVQRELFRTQADPRAWAVTTLALPTQDEARPVWKAFPALQPIATRIDLHPVLLRPKVLDLLASRIVLGQAPDFKAWVGESDFIAWFWDTEVRKGAEGPARARFAQMLAERQATLVSHEVPTDQFSPADLGAAAGLVADRICAEPENRITFGHDLFGDWARQNILVGRKPMLGQLAELATQSPLWHKPIRLYGLHLLESREKGAEWVRLIQQPINSKQDGSELAMAQELLLEAAILAPNSQPVLERALPDLLRDEGALLKRLLDCFLHVATIPNPEVMAYAQSAGFDQAEAALVDRRPLWPFWLPMLRFLAAHFDQVAPVAPWALVNLLDAWLRRSGARWPLRREAASMALRLADMFGAKDDVHRAGLHGEAEETMYRAALAGAPDLPDEVAAFALRIAHRIAPEPEPAAAAPRPPRPTAKTVHVISSLYGDYDETVPPPWPDGPKARVDAAFQRVCLTPDGLLPLVQARPATAKEVLLACLIDEPKPRSVRDYMTDLHFSYAIEKPMQWLPAFFTRGPFLRFLQTSPDEALDGILRLTNFAVDRWREHGEARGGGAPTITVSIGGQPKRFIGGYQMMYWYRAEMGPEAVEVALMALEKYLYDLIDADKDPSPIMVTILERSNSVAPLGVLIAAAKKQPKLFTGVLSALLSVPELYEWERARTAGGDDLWRTSWGVRGNGMETKMAVDWNSMRHRSLSLQDVALHLFHNHKESRQLLEEARKNWESRASELGGDAGDKLLNLAALFDAANWHPENSDPEKPRLQFIRPKELQERNAPHLKRIQAVQLLLLYPAQCRRILDGELRLSQELDAFWSQLQEIAAMEVPDGEEPERKEHALCGGIAVLTLQHREWLFADSEKKRWCEAQLLRVIQRPPAPSDFDSPVGRASWCWDRFCAQAAPAYWAEDLASPKWRRAVAHLALSAHFETVSYLFLGCIALREKLQGEFLAIQHLLLLWAAEHAAWYEKKRGQDLPDLERRGARLVDQFVAGKIKASIPEWEKIAAGRRVLSHDAPRRKKPRQLPGFEIQLLQAAFQVFPPLSEARDEPERAQWIAMWRNALGVTIRMIGEPDEDGLDGTPYEYDDWVLGRAAETIVEMRESERPESLWQPVIGLGEGARDWVEQFFRQWFKVGRRFDALDSPFFRQWQAMIEHAKRAPGWKPGPNAKVNHHFELWKDLLGLSLFDQLFWGTERRAMANAMKPHLKAWADAHLDGGGAVKLYASFLMRDATIDLVPDGIIWMDAGMHGASKWYWDERDVSSELASFLAHAWGRSAREIKTSPDAKKAFNRILTELTSRSEPLALQLRDQIARSG